MNMQPKDHHLAEVNIGRLVAAPDDPRLKDFVENLNRINGIAKRMDGFVWMLEGEQGGNLDNPLGEDPLVAFNLSVWKDVESLDQYVWGTLHRKFYERRAEWFEVFQGTYFCHVVGSRRSRSDQVRGNGARRAPSGAR